MQEKVIIFSAPSGAGKTTITHYILENVKDSEFSVSATTRKPRLHEKDGVDYYFISIEAFKNKIENNEFIEWEEVYKNSFYGTLTTEVKRIWAIEKVVLFDVDVVGGRNLKQYFGEKALSLFIMPPSIGILEERLRKRGTETEEAIQLRIKKASKEMSAYKFFDTVILNDDLIKAQKDALIIINKFLNS